MMCIFHSSNFKLIKILIVALAIGKNVHGLYEDQIGKFDWRQHYVGKLKYGAFDSSSLDRIIVATESNALAAISAKSGELIWRQVLEKGPRGDIKLLHIPSQGNGIQPTGSRYNRAFDIITVTGDNPALVRGWNSNSGVLEWEWSLYSVSPERIDSALWFIHEGTLYHVVPVWQSHLELTGYVATSGQQTKATTSRISATWIKDKKCALAASFFACAIDEQILAIDLLSEKIQIIMKQLDAPAVEPLKAIAGEAAVIQDDRYYSLSSEKSFQLDAGDAILVDETIFEGEKVVLQLSMNREQNTCKLSAKKLTGNEPIEAIGFTINNYPQTLGASELVSVRCKISSSGDGGSRNQPVCRFVLSTEDGTIVLIQQGNIKWTREEALADVEAVDFLDLTLSDAEGAIEEELNNKNGDVFGALQRRIYNQISHVKNLALHVLGLGPAPSKAQKAGLVRDDFGLHKMIVVITKSGKIFGIDNISGKHHWVRYLPEIAGFANGQSMKLLVQRTSRFYPLTAQCIILGRHKDTKNGLIYQFNPITGQPINGGIIHLPYKIRQVSLLHETGPDFLRALLILDEEKKAHVLPESSAKFAHNFYMFSANRESAVLEGHLIEFRNGKLSTIPTWTVNLGGAGKEQKIVAMEGKNPIEHVHSQGRVLADRSVLYKYINPNLIAVATHGLDNIHKYILNVHLLDVVSGSIVFSMSHKRVQPPLHMVHSENWLIYSYYNDKVRRTEITSIELYEGKSQTNSTVWSSLDTPPLPLVERQSYILPVSVAAMKETITEKGITNKHILIGLSTGVVAEMSWALLDPRRPVTSPEKAREEGIIPYMPELPMPHEILINYNQTIANLKGIHTAPSGLESTCLVFAHGLDIFVTRVAPSKTFDLLKEDFDYFLITVVLVLLTSTSYVVKHLASKKAIKQAWK
ncbi:ER membrane protein complex subunit 1 isoform X2 [Toxorhynchites rutilus septentrionalis]|uniref:ER membrane protein complex subunit 1 isoform X2 n=1 Tax=Toxorhynchites rutilus septentrionalis TaxID=329112 RepID=UPI00247A988C|nr:ER membrane protein complex subunit 1 isoform X2 [Toxorhynchites rutilus septentrionalis]